jgi:ATP-dependent RNA helicase DDX42
VRSIANHCRPDRQTLLFSATFKKRIEKLAREILIDPVKIVQGEVGEACDDVTQIIKVFSEGSQKWKWLTDSLVEFTSSRNLISLKP